jgi:hypothetical protein
MRWLIVSGETASFFRINVVKVDSGDREIEERVRPLQPLLRNVTQLLPEASTIGITAVLAVPLRFSSRRERLYFNHERPWLYIVPYIDKADACDDGRGLLGVKSNDDRGSGDLINQVPDTLKCFHFLYPS